MDRLKSYKTWALILTDIFLVNISYMLAFYFRFVKHVPVEYIEIYKRNALDITVIYIVSLSFFKLYKSLWSYASIDEFLMAIGGCIAGSGLSILYGKINLPRLPYSVSILACIFSILLIVGFRISFRVYRRLIVRITNINKEGFQNVMVVGAGQAGILFIKEMQLHREMKYSPVALIDDDPIKMGNIISGVEVMGNRNDIVRLSDDLMIDVILIAIPSIDNKRKEEIINICKETNCKLKIVPGVYSMLAEKAPLSQIRDVDVEDLLGREPIKLDMDGIRNYIEDQVVLVTGGGGSIGSELCRQLAQFNPRSLVVLDIYENNAYDLQNEIKFRYPSLNLRIVIASVRDKVRLSKVFAEIGPDVVFHAAAHKHVPLMEDNPSEAVKNNIIGTLNVAECSDKYRVKKFVLISSDKAVNPTNVMGATKRVCEMIIQSIDKISETEFVAVRFGNVLGSNGSVIPLFKKQISNGGPITVTHKEITRFFMTIPEAAQLVLQAGAFAEGGEIFILDMGSPVKIYDLAMDLIRLSGLKPFVDIDIIVTGLRPGEKLYEEILLDEEGITKTSHKKIYIAKPSNYDYVFLKNQIGTLAATACKENDDKIIEKLKEIVTTYRIYDTEEVAASI